MEEKKYKESDIQSLDGMEHVRLRPQLYFEDCFKENNLNSLVFGSLCHAIDEYFDDNCNEIIVSAKENSFNIRYNAGMSLEKSWDLTKAECIMTKIGACSNEKKHLEVGHEFCDVGMTPINAVSEKCELKTIWNKQKGHFIFEKGKTIFKEISGTDISEESTTISFQVDNEIFGNAIFELNDLQLKLNSLKEKLPNLKLELYKL
jgi:DNA gyrase/topoisomerase IV subunit B